MPKNQREESFLVTKEDLGKENLEKESNITYLDFSGLKPLKLIKISRKKNAEKCFTTFTTA